MKNTCTGLVVLAILVLAMLVTPSLSLSSKIRVRAYRKTLHEIVEKNGALISEFASLDLGSIDISDKTMKNTVISLRPQAESFDDMEAELKFIEGKGVEVAFNDFKFEVKGQIKNAPATFGGNIDKIFTRLVIKETPKSGSVPDFEIEDYKVSFEKESIKWTIDGESVTDATLNEKTFEWLNLTLEGQVMAAKFLLNQAQTKLTDYIKKTLEFEGENGSRLTFSAVSFFEDYLEISLESIIEVTEEEEEKFRNNEKAAKEAGDDSNALEVVVDENLINAGLHVLFHMDHSVGLRKSLRVDDPSNEYGSMFDNVLMTQVVSQAWKELDSEFGADKVSPL